MSEALAVTYFSNKLSIYLKADTQLHLMLDTMIIE